MHKKLIFSLITIFGLNAFCLAPAFAEEGIMPISETEGVPVVTSVDGDTVEGTINPDEIDESDTVDVEFDSNLENEIDHNGTSGEPEVVCADASEPGCEDEAVEPETWTLYLSLGALGATVILIIIINLFGRRKK